MFVLKMEINKKILFKIRKFSSKQGQIIKDHAVIFLCIIFIPIIICFLVAALFINNLIYLPQYCHISIDVKYGPQKVINEKFLSLGLDSSVIVDGFKNFNMTDPKLIQMMKYISPAYLRIGGNQADQIIFSKKNKTEDNYFPYDKSVFNESKISVLSESDWLKLYKLAKRANIDIIYDLNSLLRYENGSWFPENAEEMIKFSQDNGLKLDWELGNEPNSYQHKFNTSVNPTQLGIDYINLRNILNNYDLYKDSKLVGPSTTRLRTMEIESYFTEFLISGSEAVSAVTWHHYYFSGENATSEEFLNPKLFDYLSECIKQVNDIRDFLGLWNKPFWLGETSSAWHSGAPNLSDRFIGSFLWIDKLGLSAKMGIDVVVRQSLFKGNYALLDDSYDPNPDWWVSVLYKKLINTSVIETRTLYPSDGKIRLYTHCAKTNVLWNGDRTAIVVFGVNLQDKTGFVKIDDLEANPRVYVYTLTSEGSLFSQNILLNGKVLKLQGNLELPDLKPQAINRKNVLSMPAYSIVFWVFTDTNVRYCSK